MSRKFQDEPHIIMFGLAIDGVCPLSFLSSNYNIWIVRLIVCDIPPWMTFQKDHFMLTLIIKGKHEVKKWRFILGHLLMRCSCYGNE